MKIIKPTMPKIVVDTREKTPYAFDGSIKKTLKSGDYSLVGFETEVAIERKTKIDAYGSLGKGRERFEREVKRLSEYKYAAIVIECTLRSFLSSPSYKNHMGVKTKSRLNPVSAVSSLLAWSVRHGVHIHFASDRRHAMALTKKLLTLWWTNEMKLKEQNNGRVEII